MIFEIINPMETYRRKVPVGIRPTAGHVPSTVFNRDRYQIYYLVPHIMWYFSFIFCDNNISYSKEMSWVLIKLSVLWFKNKAYITANGNRQIEFAVFGTKMGITTILLSMLRYLASYFVSISCMKILLNDFKIIALFQLFS